MTIKRIIEDTLYNLDRVAASALGAAPQETLSSQIGRAALRGCWWGKVGRWMLDGVSKDHCEKAIRHADELNMADNGDEQ